MVKKIDNIMQSIASEAYKKTARRDSSWAVSGEGETSAFKREYLQVLVRDYFYSGYESEAPKEQLAHLQKLKASIDSLQLPPEMTISRSTEEISLGNFVKLLEEEMTSFEENKEEKLKEEQKKLKELSMEEIENIAARTKGSLTLGDIEKYRHGERKVERKELPPEVIAQLKKHFENQGITPTDEHEEIARRLLETGAELSKAVCNNIDLLIQAKNKELSQDRIEELAKQFATIQKIELTEWNRSFPLSPEQVRDLVDELAQLEDGYQQRIGMHFHTIEEALDNYRQSKPADRVEPAAEWSKSQISFQYIRYKMTMEKAMALNSRGIAIDKTELITIEKELLRLEISAENLQRAAIAKGMSEDAALTELLGVEHALIDVMGSDYGSVTQMMTRFSLKQLSGVGIANQAAMAIHRYDALGTVVRSDLGDSINKAFYRLNSLLSANGIEVSDANLRAAEILGRAQAEINNRSIEAIKEIDQRLQLVLRGLTPEAALELMEKGKDILNMSLEELSEFADQRESKDLRKLSDRVARRLHQMEKSGKLSAEDKEQMILFYRLLHTIEKSEGGAAAFLMKDGRNINLENLYDAARYLQSRASVDARVTADMGMLENGEFTDLKEQIRQGFLERKREIRELLRTTEQSLLGEREEEAAAERLELLKSYSLRELDSLFQAFKQPSMTDAEMYKQFQRTPFLWADSLRKLEKTAEGNERAKQKLEALKRRLALDETSEEQEEEIRRLLKEMETELIAAESKEEKQIFSALIQTKKDWEYGKRLKTEHEFVQLPVWVGNDLRQINLYYPQAKQAEARERGELRTLLSFEAGSAGKVSGLLEFSAERGALLLQTDLASTEQALKAKKNEIIAAFRQEELAMTSLAMGSFLELTPFHEKGKALNESRQEELLAAGEVNLPAGAENTVEELEKKLPRLAKALAALIWEIEKNSSRQG